ncbi:uncharacterized protein YraI [Angulomicrobium tetraedrale]|uniref:Uncharacterized protein YraI n=1 Tax=Ancylobacter tetraedralis TaxID=217068 RepID=A0A839ZER1_9HYPH|nr:SH3 domain-containing protein [Ancylobacter tetraedralis]MBB3773249.1 uncharacterized protein YraI [Ancylobacter tetraedralis]
MKRILASVAVLLALGGAALAQERGYVTTNVNLRAGPSTAYPAVVILEAGTPLRIYGCLQDYTWCDVNWRGNRGWIAARYLGYEYRGRQVEFYDYAPTIGVPIIGFSFGEYWGNNYRGRSWYSNNDRWGPPPPRGYRPPPPGPGYGPPPPGYGRPPGGGFGPPPGQGWSNGPPQGNPNWNNNGRPPQGGPPPQQGNPNWNNNGRPPQGGPPPQQGNPNWNNGGGRPPQGGPPPQQQAQPPRQPPQASPQGQQDRCVMQPRSPGCPQQER